MSEVQTPKKEPGDIYLEASVLAQSEAPADLAEAYRLFSLVPEYLDAKERAAALKPKWDQYQEDKKRQELADLQNANRKKKTVKSLITVGIILAVLVTGVLVGIHLLKTNYEKAVALMEEGEYREADNIFKFLFGYQDSADRRDQLKETLDAFDSIKSELLSDEEISSTRMNELHAALQLMPEFSEAEELLGRFTRRKTGHNYYPATGTHTDYEYLYDEAGNQIGITASAPVSSGEMAPLYTQYTSGSPEDSQMTVEWDFGSRKISNSTVIKETTFYENSHETEKEIVTQKDGTTQIFYRWYDAESKVLYGIVDNSELPKTTSKLSVVLESRMLDENGRLVRSWQQEVDKKGKPDDKEKETVYTYDENGNLTLEIHYKTTEKKGKVDYKVTYSYDEQGRLADMVEDDVITVYHYNEFGELRQVVVTKDKKENTYNYFYSYVFDKDGLE